MDSLAAARDRLERASCLPAVLGAACDAFEDMLPVIEMLQVPGAGAFAAFMLCAAAAANGRDAVAEAPSLPSTSAVGREPPCAELQADSGTAVRLAGLCQVLAGKLASAREMASDPDDLEACARASRYATEMCSLLRGARPGD